MTDENRELKKALLDAIGLGLLKAKMEGAEFDGRRVDYAERHEDPNPERGRVALFVGMEDGTTLGIVANDVPNIPEESH